VNPRGAATASGDYYRLPSRVCTGESVRRAHDALEYSPSPATVDQGGSFIADAWQRGEDCQTVSPAGRRL
jgi:hypothetical protein